MLRDLILAVSLANLCLFRLWTDLLPGASKPFFMTAQSFRAELTAGLLSFSILSGSMWVAWTIARRWDLGRKVARWAFVLALIVALNGVRQQVVQTSEVGLRLLGKPALDPVGLGLMAVAALALFRWRQRIVLAAVKIVLVVSPFVVFVLVQAAWSLARYEASPTEKVSGRPVARLTSKHPAHPRVLWLVFDGMGQRETFLMREPSVRLPEVDDFRRKAFYARNAYPPADSTLVSIPSLTTGRPISLARPVGADKLMLRLSETQEVVRWGAVPDLFSRARDAGFGTAVVSSYIPYCRVIGHRLTFCHEESTLMSWEGDHSAMTFSQRMLAVVPTTLGAVPLASKFHLPGRLAARLHLTSAKQCHEAHIKRYLRVLDNAKKAATDPQFDLIFVHFPVPHWPYIYDRAEGDFARGGSTSYSDNLALVDRALGDLRRAMERAGTWETTTILITSDHGNNWVSQVDDRVPFLVRVANDAKALAYDRAFSTVLIHGLALALLRGEVSDTDGVARWLDEHGPSMPIRTIHRASPLIHR